MKINSQSKYALGFCRYLSTHPGVNKVRDVCAATSIPTCFGEHIARRLRLKGITRTVRGPGGGVVLVRRDTTALQIFNAVDEIDLDDTLGLGKVVREHLNSITLENEHASN